MKRQLQSEARVVGIVVVGLGLELVQPVGRGMTLSFRPRRDALVDSDLP